jgi:signal transduction histidine kinase
MLEITDPFDTRSPRERLEITRRKRLILANLTGAIYALIPFGIFVALIILPVKSLYANIVFGLSIGTIPITFLARWIVNKDKLTLGSLLFLVYAIGAVSINSLLFEGLLPVLAPTLIILTVIGGMMLKTFEGYIVGVVSAFAYILVRILTINNQFPLHLPLSSTLLMELFLTTLVFVFIAYFNRLSTRDLRRSLDEATYDLIRLNKEVREASERKSQFTARTSHELRTPLSAIIVFADLALREAYGPLNEKMRNAMQHIVSSARHLKRIINDLLDLAKIEAGEFEICNEPYAVTEIVDVIEGTCLPIATEKGLDCSITIDKDMPQTLTGDCERVSQIALNLAGNAVKFTDKGQVLVRIECVDDGMWRIVVSDSGPGIPEDQQEKVFEAFRSLDKSGSKSVAASTGLGLAIARNLVELMGGTIRLESELGVGSTFEIRLPLQPATPEMLEPEAVSSEP